MDYAERVYADDGTLPPVMKAVSALLFKCEGQAILRHPEWGMQDRLLWGRMDLSGGTVEVGGVAYPLRTLDFPTFSKEDPYALDADERELVEGFAAGFRSSARLQAHVRWLFERGSVYKTLPGLLLFHGCVPLNDDGTFAEVDCGTGRYAGKRLLDWTDALCRYAWSGRDQWALDWMGYLWCGWQSTFAGRVVKTFERTYIADESTWKEPEDPYYALTREDPAPCEAILAEFGLDPACSRIVNGHTPVKLPKGESPVRGAGKRLVIDGGFCRAYRSKTGIAGDTLNVGAEGLSLVEHGEFPGKEAVLRDFADTGHGVALEL